MLAFPVDQIEPLVKVNLWLKKQGSRLLTVQRRLWISDQRQFVKTIIWSVIRLACGYNFDHLIKIRFFVSHKPHRWVKGQKRKRNKLLKCKLSSQAVTAPILTSTPTILHNALKTWNPLQCPQNLKYAFLQPQPEDAHIGGVDGFE